MVDESFNFLMDSFLFIIFLRKWLLLFFFNKMNFIMYLRVHTCT